MLNSTSEIDIVIALVTLDCARGELGAGGKNVITSTELESAGGDVTGQRDGVVAGLRSNEQRKSISTIRKRVDTRGADQGGAACTGGGRVSQGFREKKVSAE